MNMEHKAIIERAKLAGMPPSYIAHELMVHDLVEAGLSELKNLHSPYGKLNEGQQQEAIERLTDPRPLQRVGHERFARPTAEHATENDQCQYHRQPHRLWHVQGQARHVAT